MTNARVDNKGNVPNDLIVKYYKQRAIADLLISEGTWVSKEAAVYIKVPGIYTQEQIDGWKIIFGSSEYAYE